ncbi:hypothetical protein ACIP64_40940, partial [Streptomyces sp. NPDC088733]
MSEQPQDVAEPEVAPTCQFPGCGNPPEPKDPTVPGPAPKYCVREDHNPLTAYRAKKRKAAGPAGTRPVQEPDTDHPVTGAAADAVNVREEVLREVTALRADLDRYLTLLQTVSDPEAAEAQMLAVQSDADARIASAEQRADAERSRRLTAEAVARAAEDAKTAAEEATEQAVRELDAARQQFEADAARVKTSAEQAIATARAE